MLFLFGAVECLAQSANADLAVRKTAGASSGGEGNIGSQQLPDSPSASKLRTANFCRTCGGEPWQRPTEPIDLAPTFDKRFILLYASMFAADFVAITETVHV